MAYLLDSSTLIDAKNRYYGFGICPGFWQWLCRANAQGLVMSIDRVRDELMQRQDDLTKWCKNRKPFFVDTEDGKTVDSQRILAGWVNGSYSSAAQSVFFRAADFTLVAHAHAHKHTAVTGEVAAYGAQVKIPNACKELAVPHVTVFQMLSKEKVKFNLA